MSGPELAVLDVGQGDAIVLHDPATADAILLDCPAGKAAVPLAFLESRQLTRLRTLIVSHLHDDHYGGVLDVLRHVPADHVLVSLGIGAGQAHPKVVAFLREIKRETATGNSSWSIPRRSHSQQLAPVLHHGALRITVLGPDEQAELDAVAGTNPNHASTIIRAELGSFSALLGADAPPTRWAALLRSNDQLDADVFVCPHHGGAFGPNPKRLDALLERVSPKIIIVSVGATNAHGHPDLSTLQTLGNYAIAHRARLVCTQLNRHCGSDIGSRHSCAGTVVVTHTNGILAVTTERDEHRAWVNSTVTEPHCLWARAA